MSYLLFFIVIKNAYIIYVTNKQTTHIMQKASRIQETEQVINRIDALVGVVEVSNILSNSEKNTIATMLSEYRDRHAYLNSPKEYMVHFEGGGWNTCHGIDADQALENAKKEYPNTDITSGGCVVNSVTLCTASLKASAMRLFY